MCGEMVCYLFDPDVVRGIESSMLSLFSDTFQNQLEFFFKVYDRNTDNLIFSACKFIQNSEDYIRGVRFTFLNGGFNRFYP